MPRRKRVVIKPEEEQFEVVVTGGPKKYFNRRRVHKRFARQAVHGYEPVTAEWFQDIILQLVQARHRQRMSQATLANLAETSQAEISRFELGKTNPTVELLERLRAVLQLNIEVTIK